MRRWYLFTPPFCALRQKMAPAAAWCLIAAAATLRHYIFVDAPAAVDAAITPLIFRAPLMIFIFITLLLNDWCRYKRYALPLLFFRRRCLAIIIYRALFAPLRQRCRRAFLSRLNDEWLIYNDFNAAAAAVTPLCRQSPYRRRHWLSPLPPIDVLIFHWLLMPPFTIDYLLLIFIYYLFFDYDWLIDWIDWLIIDWFLFRRDDDWILGCPPPSRRHHITTHWWREIGGEWDYIHYYAADDDLIIYYYLIDREIEIEIERFFRGNQLQWETVELWMNVSEWMIGTILIIMELFIIVTSISSSSMIFIIFHNLASQPLLDRWLCALSTKTFKQWARCHLLSFTRHFIYRWYDDLFYYRDI